MATTITKTVKSTGGDYTTLTAWEAGEQADLVALDQIRQAEVYASASQTLSANTHALVIDGWTTDATRYARIYTPSSERHSGVWDAAKFFLEVTDSADGVRIADPYVRIEGVQVHNNSLAAFNSFGVNIQSAAHNGAGAFWVVANCIFRGNINGGTSNTSGVNQAGDFTGSTLVVVNNVFYDFIGAGANASGVNTAGTLIEFYVYNNTAHNCTRGFEAQTSMRLKNNIAANCTSGFVGTAHANSTNNLSTNSTPPGSSPRSSMAVTFVDEANDNFHLAAGDTGALGYGVDLSADASWAFTDDIDGQTRSGTWDIGADEYVAAGGDIFLLLENSLVMLMEDGSYLIL